MGTVIRPELSKQNKYWIDKHRYYELKHFCLQYPVWKRACAMLDGFSKRPSDPAIFSSTNIHSDPTFKCADERLKYHERISLIERAAADTDPTLASYILKAVTEGLSYTYVKARLEIPCGKDTYYDLYRRFFWLLSNSRD